VAGSTHAGTTIAAARSSGSARTAANGTDFRSRSGFARPKECWSSRFLPAMSSCSASDSRSCRSIARVQARCRPVDCQASRQSRTVPAAHHRHHNTADCRQVRWRSGLGWTMSSHTATKESNDQGEISAKRRPSALRLLPRRFRSPNIGKWAYSKNAAMPQVPEVGTNAISYAELKINNGRMSAAGPAF
jgi:hypothetical protein